MIIEYVLKKIQIVLCVNNKSQMYEINSKFSERSIEHPRKRDLQQL